MHPTRFPRPLSRSLAPDRWLAWIVAACIASAGPAHATPIASAANVPYSGIAPGSIDMATGELILVCQPDLRLDGPMPLSFERYYGSMLASEGLASGHLGPNWLGSYDWSLSVGAAGATVVTNRGQALQFQPAAGGGWNLVSPTDQNFRLDFTDVWWRLTDPSRQQVYLFNSSTHRLSVILDAHGNGLNLFYAGSQLAQVNDGSGRALSFEYDSSGLLTRVSDGTRAVWFAYSAGVLASVTDAAGHATSYAYTGLSSLPDLLQSWTEPLGSTPLTYAYDAFGRVAGVTDASGNSSSCAWDTPSGNVWTDALGHAWTYSHDAQGRLTSLLDPAGGTTSYSYDALGRLASSTRPMGDMTSFSYDAASGRLGSASVGDGGVFTFNYGGHGVAGATLYAVAGAHYPDGASESFTRDANGNLTDWTDRGGFHWIATYNLRGEPLTLTNPAGGVTTRTYDGAGLLASETDNAGHTTSATRDAFGRVTKITWGDGTNRQFAYDNLDHLTNLIDERGKGWTYDYDPDGRIGQATDPLIEHEGFHYDAEGRLTQVIDALGNARLYAYDAAGRLASFTDRTGVVTQYQYDALGRLSHVIDPAGGTRTLTYDGNGRVPAVQDALGHTASFQYDAMDRVTHLTDPMGSGTDFAYDAMGRVLSAAGPLGRATSMSYDPRGLPTAFHDATSETDFGRTALGEIAQVSDPNHNSWPATYDPDGRMTDSADPLARATAYAYDAAGRLTHATLPLGSEDASFDAAGRPTTLGYSDGTLLTYAWDDANRATGGSGAAFTYDAAGRMTSSNGLSLTRDAEGRITGESYGGAGMVVGYAYDAAGRLASVHDWLGGMTSFAYDTTGALILVTRPDGTSAAYQYDAAGRLADLVEKQPGPINAPALAHITITRDALGQPVSIDRSQPLMPGVPSASSTTFGYDAASQVNGDTYDALGRMTSDGARSFQWDGASRLTALNDGVNAPQYAYDAFDRPLSRTLGTTSEQYVWNYANGGPTLDLVSVGGVPKTFYIHTPSGLLLEAIDATAGGRTFYHYDENGNTIFLTDDAGAVETKYAYSPWGGVTIDGAALDNPFTLGAAAGVVAIGGGLYRTGGAVYDSKTARVISGGATASGADLVARNPGPQQLGGLVGKNPGPPNIGDLAAGPQPLPWTSAQGPQPLPWLNAQGPQPLPWLNAQGPQPLPWVNAADLLGKNPGPQQIGGDVAIAGPSVRGGLVDLPLRPMFTLIDPDVILLTLSPFTIDSGPSSVPIAISRPNQSFLRAHRTAGVGNSTFGTAPPLQPPAPPAIDGAEGTSSALSSARGSSGASHAPATYLAWPYSRLPVTAEARRGRASWRGDRTGAAQPGYDWADLDVAPQPSISDFCPWCVGR